jgi:cell division protein FtsB
LTEKHAIIIALNMAEFNKKNNYNFWHSPLVLLLLFCILVLFIYNMMGLAIKERETARKKDLILSNIETLRIREKNLNSDIEKLKTDEGVEETIRDKYQVVKPDEKMVTIVDEEKNITSVVELKSKHGFIEWLKKIFNK